MFTYGNNGGTYTVNGETTVNVQHVDMMTNGNDMMVENAQSGEFIYLTITPHLVKFIKLVKHD